MKKIFTLISVFSISTASLWAQADTASSAANWKATPNPGFENWTSAGSYSNPNGWNTANSQETTLGAYNVVETSTAKSGSHAIDLITQSEIVVTAPGIATTGTIPTSASGSITGGIAYTLRPDSIVGWYECNPQSGDHGFAAVYLFGSAANNSDTVAVASFNLPATKVAAYTRFTAPFVYRNSHAVANSIWLISSSSGTGTAVAGSNAFFDDLAIVINSTVGIATQTNPGVYVTVGPNPASKYVYITNELNTNPVMAMYDITGRKIAEQKLTNGFNTIDIKNLTNGLYIYSVTDENNVPVKTGKLIVQN
jgi:hypothetical protein